MVSGFSVLDRLKSVHDINHTSIWKASFFGQVLQLSIWASTSIVISGEHKNITKSMVFFKVSGFSVLYRVKTVHAIKHTAIIKTIVFVAILPQYMVTLEPIFGSVYGSHGAKHLKNHWFVDGFGLLSVRSTKECS